MAEGTSTEKTYLSNVGDARPLLAAARLGVLLGPDAPVEIVLPVDGATIGIAQSCALRLTDTQVSRQHVEVTPEGAAFRVRDLGSTNGTYLDGVRITDAIANAGATLRIGRTTIHIFGRERYAALPPSTKHSFGELIGHSVAMRQVFSLLERVVRSDASVLIEGETGTGKEGVARALYTEGSRRGGPFVVLDCSAISASLAESELFGHERGAFTGALVTRPGAFERASGGILFLDEVGELPLDLQPKLLRALETREILRVGGQKPISVDVRIVAGTNRDLERMVRDGRFRADLFFRLAIVRVILPALRDRKEDLDVLVARFLEALGVAAPGPIAGPNFELLTRHAWPGNVRELRNVLTRAVACAGTTQVAFAELPIHLGDHDRADELPAILDTSRPFLEAKDALVSDFERRYFTALLQSTSGNVAEAARRSKLNRRYLYDILKKHDLL